MKDKNNEFLWRQFCRLGEMIGDGLHHEEPWISKEYNKISRILNPDFYKEIAKQKSESIDKQMLAILEKHNCACGGKLKQSRKGSKVCYCITCNKRYKAKSKK